MEAKKESLVKLQNGADPLDVQAQELSVKQKEDAYQDYFIRAPFDGVLASLSVQENNEISSGSSIGTFITRQKIADISLNEVDVSKIKEGDKATLTFDAISGLTIAGQVAQINLVGTVSQGVVSYDVKIGFDTQDNRVKSGMSVSAAIITNARQDILVVPNSAVKTQNGTSYVQILDQVIPQATGAQGVTSPSTPRSQTIQIGITDDTNTEIVSGLKEGDMVITKTISATSTAATKTTTPNILQSVGGGGGALRGAAQGR
jgi:HlyD family secretion protein